MGRKSRSVVSTRITHQILSIALTLSLLGCSALDLIKPKPSIDVDAQIGKENTMQTGVVVENEVDGNQVYAVDMSTFTLDAEDIETDQVVGTMNIDESVSMWFILLMVGGWLAPTPTRMFYMWKNRDGKESK